MRFSLFASLTLFIWLMGISSVNAVPENFDYSYTDPSEASAQQYIISKNNVELYVEGSVTYWKPKFGDSTKASTTPGTIIYKFHLDGTMKSGFLNMYASCYHWWYSQGHAYLYASSDGQNWTQLAEAAPPGVGGASYAHYNGLIPERFLHKNDLYLKVELLSYGDEASKGGIWTNTAQHSRYQHGSDVRTFELGVEFDRWLLNPDIRDADKGEIAYHIMPGHTYVIEQPVINPTKNTVKAQLSYSLPVSSGDNKNIGQSDVHLEANTQKKISTQVRVPLDTIKGVQKLTSVLRDSATKDALDLHNRSVFLRYPVNPAVSIMLLLHLTVQPEE